MEEDMIYVTDKYEQLIAIFRKDDEDTLINPRIRKTQNSEAIFEFSINLNNPKWKQIDNPENLYWIDGMVFSTNFDGCFEETISQNNEKLMNITAYERQKLLTRKYVNAWNSETGFEKIDIFMVVILSKGDLPLKNAGEFVNSEHLPGTSGYALDALLYGTGWTTGDCDVEGTFDLESDQVDIYTNILKVQEIWGGILVFDSKNKIIHHRDETLWIPDNGYEVKYQKNMQSADRIYNNKIVTKLCPLGESGLNIGEVNNGKVWLEDYTYTNTVLEGIENNPDISDPEQLMRWGKRKLQDLCKPAKHLTVNAVLLYQLEGYELEKVDLNEIVTVVNYNGINGEYEKLRVVGFDYGVWDKSDATLELNDITLDSTDIFKKTLLATKTITNGTLDSSKVISFNRDGKSVDESLSGIDEVIEKVQVDWGADSEKIWGKVTETETGISNLTGEILTQTSRIATLEQTIAGLQEKITISGGDNLIRNSVGAFRNEFWEGTIEQYTSTDVSTNNESDSAIILKSGSIMQELNNIRNGYYNISFNYKKLKSLANISVKIKDDEYVLSDEFWSDFEKVIEIKDNYFRIEFKSDTVDSLLVSDLILIFGREKKVWSQNANETSTDTVSIGKGIQVESNTTNTFTRIDSDGNRTFNKITGQVVSEQTDKGTVTEELVVRNQATINNLLIERMGSQVWLVGMGG